MTGLYYRSSLFASTGLWTADKVRLLQERVNVGTEIQYLPGL